MTRQERLTSFLAWAKTLQEGSMSDEFMGLVSNYEEELRVLENGE